MKLWSASMEMVIFPVASFLPKKDSGNAVDPRITPGVCCRKDGDIWQAAKVDQALRIAARWTKRWILVGDVPNARYC